MRPHILSLILFFSICDLPLAIAASWGFNDATVSVHGKKAGVGGGEKQKLVENKSLPDPILLGVSDTLKILLTTTEDKQGSRPHQAFLLLREPKSNLDTSFPLSVKDGGKGKLELSQKDLPVQFASRAQTLSASLVIASFGSSKPYRSHAFDLKIHLDPSAPPSSIDKPLRYGKLPEIHHIFKSDPKSPPKIITIVFAGAVVAALPTLLIVVWSSNTSPDRPMLMFVPHPVALVGSKHQPHVKSLRKLTTISRRVLPFDTGYGRDLFHVLHVLESLSDITRCCCCRIDLFPERKQGFTGSPGAKTCWSEIEKI
ncbi:MAG: hypothetical protein LQ349_008399 [Xanthoria aureola]|nr:MAG: hypothetical protein LQ349_008399 [Xanthoria aureola]